MFRTIVIFQWTIITTQYFSITHLCLHLAQQGFRYKSILVSIADCLQCMGHAM